jgi:hypothetical protein
MKLLALHWRTILDLYRQAFTCQMEDRGSVHLPLPQELRPVLGVQARSKTKEYDQ